MIIKILKDMCLSNLIFNIMFMPLAIIFVCLNLGMSLYLALPMVICNYAGFYMIINNKIDNVRVYKKNELKK